MKFQQLHIRKAASCEDRERVERILVAAAQHFGMEDNTVTSGVPDTIRSYVERIGYGLGIGARIVGELVVVEFNRRGELSPDFRAAVEHITSKLRQEFGERVYPPEESDQIEVQSTLTVSEASREFHRKHFKICR